MSAPTTLLANEYATLVYHADKKIVHHTFHKFIRGENFREVLNKGLEQVERHGATKWLSDDRGNSALDPSDNEWATNVWTPRMKQAGWKFWAVLLPEKVIGQMSLKRMIQHYASIGVQVQIFSDPTEAMAWLEQQKN